MSETKETMARLAAPFAPDEIEWKPMVVSGNRALAAAYIDARAVQDRLDQVVGPENWQDDYKPLEDGSVVCRLRVRINDQWIAKTDVGSQSDQKDAGDRRKAAFSDALKRAAVKFGIGRYLYRLPSQWVDYDAHKKQFTRVPQLPAWATPGKQAAKKTDVKAEGAPAQPAGNLPASGVEFQRRLYDYDAKLAKQGLIAQGALVKHVVEQGVKAGHAPDLATWNAQAIAMAAEVTRQFEAQARQPKPAPAPQQSPTLVGTLADAINRMDAEATKYGYKVGELFEKVFAKAVEQGLCKDLLAEVRGDENITRVLDFARKLKDNWVKRAQEQSKLRKQEARAS